MVAANLVALAIYLLVPPLAPFVFWLVNGFLLGREYFRLVAMRRLGPEAAAALRRRHFGRIWLAGTAMAVPLSVPVAEPPGADPGGGSLHPPVPSAGGGRDGRAEGPLAAALQAEPPPQVVCRAAG